MPHRQLKDSIKILVIAIITILAIGTVLYSALEGWSYVDAFYFVTMTATTVGYGDFTPTHDVSKLITIFYSLAIVPFILYAFSMIAKYEVERVYKKIHGVEVKMMSQEEEMERNERKIVANRRKLKEQEVELEKTERKLKKEAKINRDQEKEIEGQKRKIQKTRKRVKEAEAELDVVEDIVVEEVVKKSKK